MKIEVILPDDIVAFDNAVAVVHLLECEHCGREFRADHPAVRFCSESHRVMHWQKRNRGGATD